MPTLVVRFQLERPLEELATVFDMANVAFRVARHPESHRAVVVSREPGVAVRMAPSPGPDYHLELVLEPERTDIEALADALALALQADGIDARMLLVDAAGTVHRRLTTAAASSRS